MASNSKKRKLPDEQKFYAVRAGKTPGVYLSWKECQAMITGFKGASFKSFTSHQEAQDYVDGKASSGKQHSDRFYGVAVGKLPGVYLDWGEAQEMIKDVKGPKYKRFDTRAEAEEFVRSGGKATGAAASKDKVGKKGKEDRGKVKKVENEVVDEEEEDGEEEFQVEEKVVKKSKRDGGLKRKTIVYTDGSSLGNGQEGSVAGVGVYFGDLDERNISEPLEGSPQTNNRAELTGILRALQLAPPDRDLEIITDSNYSINCVTVWYKSWKNKGWKASSGKDVENQDLIKGIRTLIEERDGKGVGTAFVWIKGHSEDKGNEAADRLAVAGAHLGRARRGL